MPEGGLLNMCNVNDYTKADDFGKIGLKIGGGDVSRSIFSLLKIELLL